jgi:hypothetical protein
MPTQATNHNELLNWQRGDPKNPPHVGFSTAVKPDGTLNILFNIQNPSDFPAYDISVRLYDMDNLPKSPPRLRDILHRSIANIDIPTLAPNVVKFIGSIDVPPTVSAKRFGAQFTTRVGAFFENIAAQRVKSNWLFAIQVRRFDASSEQIFLKVDPGFPVNAAGDVEW